MTQYGTEIMRNLTMNSYGIDPTQTQNTTEWQVIGLNQLELQIKTPIALAQIEIRRDD